MFDKVLNKLPYSPYAQEYIGWIEFSIIEYLETVAQPRPTTLLKRRLRRRCFLVNLAKFLRTAFFMEHLQ